MSGKSGDGQRRRARASAVSVEGLESRALLATGAFVAPDLTPYIRAAFHGSNTGPATIQRMLSSLESQLTSGPLADLQSGVDTPDTFATDVNDLITSYQSNVALQLSPRFPTITNILNAEGTKVSSLVAAYETQLEAGLIDDATFATDVANAIHSLTGGPLRPLNTPNAGFAKATSLFEEQLRALVPTLAPGATPSLTIQEVSTIVDAEALAYRDAMAASLVTHPRVLQQVDNAVVTLTNSVATIAAGTSSDPAGDLTQAINVFDQALLDTTGLFGPRGAHNGRR